MKQIEVRYCAVCGKEVGRSFFRNDRRVACSNSCAGKTASHPSFEERLWSNIVKRGPDECWEWIGYKKNGYGCIWKETKFVYAHRVICETFHGTLHENIEACHTCDNHGCCNPAHLFPGTHTDNMRDMIAKGRAKHPSMKGGHKN